MTDNSHSADMHTTSPAASGDTATDSDPKVSHMAGAFDIRNVIGALLGIYGVVLIISSVALDPGTSTLGEAKDSAYNLWAGAGMVVVAAVFFLWSKISPIRIDDAQLAATPPKNNHS